MDSFIITIRMIHAFLSCDIICLENITFWKHLIKKTSHAQSSRFIFQHVFLISQQAWYSILQLFWFICTANMLSTMQHILVTSAIFIKGFSFYGIPCFVVLVKSFTIGSTKVFLHQKICFTEPSIVSFQKVSDIKKESSYFYFLRVKQCSSTSNLLNLHINND